uniref:Carboxylic ester hydrolase n=1 Tax=Coccolithus braarudii TaxID=221442 RepID=A0A7S0Q867_9EUKA
MGFAAFNSSSIGGSNNGFRDLVEGLNWVRRHIAAFGGDPERVTIYGESAGGQGVAALLTSPLSKGLFRAAIAESAGETNTVLLAERMAHTAAILSHTACDPDDLECLQGLNSTELVHTVNSHIGSDEGNHWAAVTVGDDFSPDTALRQIKAGAFSRVPFMLGSNADEGSLFINATSLTNTEAECVYEALGDSSDDTAKVLKGLYPIIPGQNNLGALIDLYSDVAMHCPHRELAQALDEAGASPWVYSFNRSPGCPLQPKLGASHGFEVPYVFQQLDVLLNPLQPNCEPPSEDEDLAKQIGFLWAFFAREGGQVPSWPRFEAQTKGQVAKLDLGLDPLDVDTETGYRRFYCARLAPLCIPAFGRTSIQLNAAVERCKGVS